MSEHAKNVTMSEGGLYSLATKGAKDVIDIATPRVLDAIRAMHIPTDRREFSLADTGCADAGTSLDLVHAVIEQLQKTSPEIHTTVIYVDQPANDFNALVNIVHGQTEFDSWLGKYDNVWALVSGSSFYLQSVPDQSLDLVFSATAMHWLSRKPCDISNHVHMVGATGAELDSFSAQGAEDWQTILLHRARELKSGGKMVLVNFCRDERGRYLGNTGGVNMFDTFNEIWQELLDQGLIDAAEYQRMTLPQYYNTVEEFSEPLTNPGNPCYQSGLRLDNIETKVVRCPFAEQFDNDGDLEKFADSLIPTIRSWNQSIFYAGLSSSRSHIERNEIIEHYYAQYRARVLADPTGHGMDYVHAYMTISRV